MQDGLNNHPGHSFVLAKSSKHAENNISKVQKCDHASSSNKKKKAKTIKLTENIKKEEIKELLTNNASCLKFIALLIPYINYMYDNASIKMC